MRHLLHKAICWYLKRCAGVFHCYTYGEAGCYVVLMTDEQYRRVNRTWPPGITQRQLETILVTNGLIQAAAIEDPFGYDGGKTELAVTIANQEINEIMSRK